MIAWRAVVDCGIGGSDIRDMMPAALDADPRQRLLIPFERAPLQAVKPPQHSTERLAEAPFVADFRIGAAFQNAEATDARVVRFLWQ